jgi:membrane protein implicated in regulation of membrane protease activity
MDQVNALRAILVAGAVVAALLTALAGIWVATALFSVGVVAHALLWRHLRRTASPTSTSD